MDPSPDQGWRCLERQRIEARANVDGLLALAFVHHLAIARNIPLSGVVDWIVDLAPTGVIEFVPKEDSTVRLMLALRQDIFPDYDVAHFSSALGKRARIVRVKNISGSGRQLFEYERQ